MIEFDGQGPEQIDAYGLARHKNSGAGLKSPHNQAKYACQSYMKEHVYLCKQETRKWFS